MEIVNRAVVEIAMRLREGGFGKDEKDLSKFNDGGKKKADRERLDKGKRQVWERKGIVRYPRGWEGLAFDGGAPWVLLRGQETMSPSKP